MIKLKQAVIVEGKYDKIKLQSVVDAVIITTDGFSIYKDKKKMELIRAFAQKDGVVILTDSDGAGFQIRSHLKSCIGGGKVYNIYIPDIFGKEKRKEKPSKEGKLGVEGIPAKILREAFEKAGITTDNSADTKPVTRENLFDDGFIGMQNSSELRRRLIKELNLPERLTTNSLLDVLNSLIGYDKYKQAVNKIKEES